MTNFSWNLGGDDAAAVNPEAAHPQQAASAPVVPAQPVVPVQPIVPVQPPQQLSRRELRNRAVDGVAPLAEPSLAEFFQIAGPQESELPVVPSLAGKDAVVEHPHPVAGSRRAARAARAVKLNEAAVEAEAARPVETVIPVASDVVPRKGKPSRGRNAGKGTPRGKSARKPRRGKVGGRRTFFSKLFSIGAMVGVGALMVSTSLPANAFYNGVDATGVQAKSLTSHAQSMKVASSAVEADTTRDSYTVSSLAEQLRLKYGNQSFLYTNDINGTIQWPFPIPVPISSGFGARVSPCGGCSSFHEGVDFTPGRGVAIGAIADGVVSQVVATHAGLGNHVVVDHVINGQKVQSVYGHMLDNSFQVTVGETVKVTQTLGLVGSTGESTGAHLHLEIHINGVPVDPFAWLKANAN